MEYKVTQRLRKKQAHQFVRIETGILSSQNSHLQDNQPVEVSVVMGTVEPVNPQPSVFPPHQNTPALIWQQQTTTGNRRVFHYLKDDGCGRLSFLRASSSPQENAEPQTPANTLTVLEPAPEYDEIRISPRTAISAGVAVNLLALSIGGYLMYASPSIPQNEISLNTTAQLKSQPSPIKATEYTKKQNHPLHTTRSFPIRVVNQSPAATLNPGDIPQEISTGPVVFSIPKTQLGG